MPEDPKSPTTVVSPAAKSLKSQQVASLTPPTILRIKHKQLLTFGAH